jgi:hypothetical protein
MKLSLQVVLAFTLLVLVTFSCKKSEIKQPTETNLTNTELANKINDFMPDEENIGSVYKKFIATYVNDDNTLKNNLTDARLDTTLWNTEVFFNNKYGFQIDTPYYQHSEYEESIGFTITGYNGSVPIVDGDELTDFLDEKEAEFSDENNDGDSIYILNTFLEYDEIREGKAYVTLSVVLGINYWGVYPPGYNPDNFSHPTSMYAIKYGYGWRGANNEYEYRYEYRTAIKLTDPDYIMVYWYKYPIFHDSPGVEGKIWHIPYYNENYILSTSGSDELNSYLQSTKDVVDDNNPMGAYNTYLGRINITGWALHQEGVFETGHTLTHYIYQKVYI